MLVLSCVPPFVTPRTVAVQAPLTMGFSRQEYWRGLHFLLQGIFLIQGSNPHLLHWQMDSLPLHHLGSPSFLYKLFKFLIISLGKIYNVLNNVLNYLNKGFEMSKILYLL